MVEPMENLDDFEITDRPSQEVIFKANEFAERELSIEHPVRRLNEDEQKEFIEKAVNEELEKSGIAKSGIKSTFIDPFNMLDFLGSRSKPSRVTWQILRRMALTCKPVAAIIQVRQNQIAAFTQVPRKPGEIGFRITTKDPKKTPTDSEKRRIEQMQDFLLNTGYPVTESDIKKGEERTDNFDILMRKLVRDTLTLDATAFEIQLKRNKKPHAI